MMHDGANVTNLAAGEILARKLYGHMKALETIETKADLNKFKRAVVNQYDVVGWIPGLDGKVLAQITDEKKAAALDRKYGPSGDAP